MAIVVGVMAGLALAACGERARQASRTSRRRQVPGRGRPRDRFVRRSSKLASTLPSGDRRAQHGPQADPERRGDDLQHHVHVPGAARPGHERPAAFAQNIAPAGRGQPVAPDLDRRPSTGTVHVQLPERRPGRLRDRVFEHVGARAALAPAAHGDIRLGRDRRSRPGGHIVAWQVAAGLNGKAKAVLRPSGASPRGSFAVFVEPAPAAVLRQQQRADRHRRPAAAPAQPSLDAAQMLRLPSTA